MRLLKTEFHDALEALKQNDNYETWKNETCRTLTIATGKLAYSTLAGFAEEIMKAFPYIKINVFAIRNDFFGETVTVSGLITGQDLKAQLLEKKASGTDLGDTPVSYTHLFSSASARIVWFVYAQVFVTISIALSIEIPLAVKRRISSGITIDLSLIHIFFNQICIIGYPSWNRE